ncbi:hypothetical protein BX666DRAFT_1997827 [Dichotomocladium elegans]|nr:hypothetical protein BX666DRAFT_1997827 [Dichotomocladium elegans]
MKCALLVIAACLSWLVAAGVTPYYITAPLAGTTWISNTSATISWKEGANEAITINLIEGDSSALMVPTGHQLRANGTRGSVTWKVPLGLNPNDRYAIRIDYTDRSTGQVMSAFSGAFKIVRTDTTNIKSKTASAPPSRSMTAAVTYASSSTRSKMNMPHTRSAAPSGSLPPNLRPSLAASTTPEAFTSRANTRYAMFSAKFIVTLLIFAFVLLV